LEAAEKENLRVCFVALKGKREVLEWRYEKA